MDNEVLSLFGDEFEIKTKQTPVKELLNKLENAKDFTGEEVSKVLKSNKITLAERLAVIKANVLRVLGKQKDDTIVIKDETQFNEYIHKAIASGRIAIDTETNNSLDPKTARLAGLCLYYPGGKQAYIPVNHRDPDTKERLSWQVTEAICKEKLEQINQSGIEQIFHNGKFDYEVLKCTCGVEVKPTWDTMVGARLLNENEPAALKWQYVTKIDKNQEKYDIEKLFTNVAYLDVDPDVFALYAAHDALLTDKLYELQKVEFEKEEYGPHKDLTGTHDLPGLRWLFHEIEMPITVITAEMELTGVAVDTDFGERLKIKYTKQLEEADKQINQVIEAIQPIIDTWKLTPQASAKAKTYASKKSKMSKEKLIATYPNEDKKGRYKLGKAPIEQLENPINLASPSQLAILFYDILGVPDSSKDGDRKTGKDELKTIKEKLANYLPKLEELDQRYEDEDEDLAEDIEEAIEASEDQEQILKMGNAAKLADMLLQRRGLAKLVTTYIDVIPALVKHWPDQRIRFHLNSLGTDTGRYSSGGKLKFMEDDVPVTVSGINIQNIPGKGPGKICRILFKASTVDHKVDLVNNYYTVPETDEVETTSGWKRVVDLAVGDQLIVENSFDTLQAITKQGKQYLLYI